MTMQRFGRCVGRVVRVFSTLPVIFCLALIAWSYYGFAISICGYLLREGATTQAIAYLTLYHPLAILFAVSFVRCVLTSPGHPLAGHKQDVAFADTIDEALTVAVEAPSAHAGPVQRNTPASDDKVDEEVAEEEEAETLMQRAPHRAAVVTVKEDGQKRFCRKCHGEKPDRTHHCSVCGMCVLKMDHHCPWINNCVGHHNQKYFYLFILYGTFYTLFVGLGSIYPLYLVLQRDNGILEINIHWVFVVICGCIFGLCLTGFWGYHTYLMLTNQTTIETYQRNRYRRLGGCLRENQPYLNLFDLGWRENICQVLGPSAWLWFIPVATTPGDGCSYPLNERAYESVSMNEMFV